MLVNVYCQSGVVWMGKPSFVDLWVISGYKCICTVFLDHHDIIIY